MGSQNSKASKSTTATASTTTTRMTSTSTLPVVGDESIMRKKKHGTSETPAQKNLRWGCDWDTADRICNFNVR
jgi:hypothetical protein